VANSGQFAARSAALEADVSASPHGRALTIASAALTLLWAALLFFFHLGAYGLWEPDEARYAEIAREMLTLRDYIVPHLNYVPYIEKPPLLYWLTALSMHLFGINEFAARLPNAIAALAGVAAVFYFASRVFDLKRAVISGAVLATSALYPIMAQILTTDMLLTAAVAIAFFAFFLHWREGGRWCWLIYFAMAFGTLTKGPVAIVLPAVAGASFLLWERDWRGVLKRFQVVPGLLLIGVICAPWFIVISIRQPDFLDFYIVGEHFRRAFQSSYSHSEPFYYYFPVVIGGMLPWSIVALAIPWRRLEPNPARRFCLIAAGAVLIIFSVVNAKLIPYILPAWPPLAVLFGDGLAGLTEMDGKRRSLIGMGYMFAILGAGLIGIVLYAAKLPGPYALLVRPAIAAAGITLVIGGGLSAICFLGNKISVGLAAIAVAAGAIYLIAGYGRLMAESTRSYAQLARQIQQRAPQATLICYPRYIQALPFYCRRRVILIGPETELAYGAEHTPDAGAFFFKRKADLLRLWTRADSPVLVLDRSALPPLQSELGSFTIVAEDRKKIAIESVHSSQSPIVQNRQQ
jgi:4-amino-4-deoxy-L-arabinose transferase-like glycosyltransferase